MTYIGDFALGSTFDVKFTTVTTAGVPITLAGSPVISAYPDNSTTELTAGITLSVGFDSRTGMHNVRVVATSGNGYAAGTNYALVITTGTVDGASVVGYVIAHFSIEARSAVRPTTAGRTLTIESDGMAHADLKEWLGAAPNALVSSRVDASAGAIANNAITAAAIAADAIGASKLAADAVTEIQSGLATAAAIAALNDLDSTAVQSAAAAALNAYDPPTFAELDAAVTALLAAIEAAISSTSRPPVTSPPAADAPLDEKIDWIYAHYRNVRVQNAGGGELLRNAANDDNIGARTNTDDGTDAIKGEWS